ncbi:MAG: cysteine desulfurase [Burkholderiales bacterium]|nr:MAG: cysteine desulfurase [Burkholderiales bacterium]
MSTLTPTAEVTESPFDVAALARLANEFFGSLNTASAPSLQPVASAGGVSLPGNPLPPGLPSGPLPQPTTTQFAGLGASVPGINLVPSGPDQAAALANPPAGRAPHAQAGNAAPDVLLTSLPGLDGRAGGQLLGVPQQVSAPAAREAVPSGYYFLEQAGAPQAPSAAGLPGVELPRPPVVGNAQAPALPSASAAPLPSRDAVPSGYYFVEPGSVASQQPSLYVLDLKRHPGAHGHHAGEAPDKHRHQAQRQPFDVHAIRRDFPILAERVNGKPLVWFDNAATTQKPRAVIDRLSHFYEHENSNIHRAAHTLAARATDAYEAARKTVAQFVNARSADEVIFVRGATEAINLVANTWGEQHVGAGDEIVVSHLEHHANIVPWQQLAARKSAHLRVIPVDDTGQVILSEATKLIGPKTKLLAVTQVSNALGTVVPVQELVAIAQRHGVTTLVDGAQSVSHLAVDVQAIGCDFFIFSGHKIFGPTGIGAVIGRKDVLDAIPPWQGGGNMIADVTFERTVFQPAPAKFEAGTGNIADAAGLGAALDYVSRIGLHHIARYEHDLLAYATEALRPIPGVRLIGTAADKASVLSFVLAGHETAAVGAALAEEGIAVRSGHHCAQPILRRFGLEATVRPSFAFYNTCDEIDHFISVVRRLARA